MKFQAIVFDAYETLFVNRSELWSDCFARICLDQSLPVDPDSLFRTWALVVQEFGKRIAGGPTGSSKQQFVSMRNMWHEFFTREFGRLRLDGDPDHAVIHAIGGLTTRPTYPETKRVLEALQETLPLALLSNADDSFLYPVLEHHGLLDTFTVVLSSEEARSYKPSAEIFSELLARLGTPPGATLMVGDSLLDDILGGHHGGMPRAWINRHGAPMDGPVKPTYSFQSLEDLLPLALDG